MLICTIFEKFFLPGGHEDVPPFSSRGFPSSRATLCPRNHRFPRPALPHLHVQICATWRREPKSLNLFHCVCYYLKNQTNPSVKSKLRRQDGISFGNKLWLRIEPSELSPQFLTHPGFTWRVQELSLTDSNRRSVAARGRRGRRAKRAERVKRDELPVKGQHGGHSSHCTVYLQVAKREDLKSSSREKKNAANTHGDGR